MVISPSKRFVFVHIYRTGGTSVSSALRRYARWRERLSEGFPPTRRAVNAVNLVFGLFDEGNRWVNGLSKHATAAEARRYLGAQRYDGYFKFAFVRNPWDWQVSVYHYIKRRREHVDHGFAATHSFAEFLERQVASKAPCQLQFLTDDTGSVIVDRIGHFESLQRDFTEICARLGLSIPRLPSLNASGRSAAYRSYYEPASAKLVATHFRSDVEHFQYDF